MWVPPAAQRELVEERRRYEAELALSSQRELLDRWSAELQRLDPNLELIRASENATAIGLKPGYFHVMRRSPTGPPELWPLEGPDGEFREPGSWLVEWLERSDMWNGRAMSERRKRELEAIRAKERAREREEEERVDELAQRWAAASRPQVLISDVKGWTPKAGARR
jgi:hypothetical protein